MLKLIGLIVVVAVAGYFTKPNVEKHRAEAQAAIEAVQSDVADDGVGGLIDSIGMAVNNLAASGVYEDFYVASHYSVRNNDTVLADCWGAFTMVKCSVNNPGADPA